MPGHFQLHLGIDGKKVKTHSWGTADPLWFYLLINLKCYYVSLNGMLKSIIRLSPSIFLSLSNGSSVTSFNTYAWREKMKAKFLVEGIR